MTLAKYFFKRFFLHVFSISAIIAVLFSLVEFFEKMARIKGVLLLTVAKFTTLNAIPTFFESLPLGTWLATCMFIKELEQQNEWEALSIVNISPKKIFNLFLAGGFVLALFSFVGKEIMSHNIHKQAEAFRNEQFKHQTQTVLFDTWLMLSERCFCHFDYLDLQKNKGNNLSILLIASSGSLEQTISCNSFKFNSTDNSIITKRCSLFTVATGEEQTFTNHRMQIPLFFKQLTLATDEPSVLQMTTYLSSGNAPSIHARNNIIHNLLKRTMSHSFLIFYPILTFLLFFLMPYHPYFKWFLILLPYPICTALAIVFEGISATSSIPILLLLPYLLTLLCVLLFWKKSLT
jgi:lipopolysaccharide export LptBFGC system permease protein LptF